MTGKRSGVLEFAVLGILDGSPMHGYELRKRLSSVLGAFHAFSYGSLYPCLKDLLARGLIVEEDPDPGLRTPAPALPAILPACTAHSLACSRSPCRCSRSFWRSS